MNRYTSSRYGNIMENKTVTIKECINYTYKKLMEIDKRALKENEELKRDKEKIQDLEKDNEALNNNIKLTLKTCGMLQEYSIPKSKIKDKIEELKNYIYTGRNAPQDFLQYRVKAKIQVLEELLREE